MRQRVVTRATAHADGSSTGNLGNLCLHWSAGTGSLDSPTLSPPTNCNQLQTIHQPKSTNQLPTRWAESASGCCRPWLPHRLRPHLAYNTVPRKSFSRQETHTLSLARGSHTGADQWVTAPQCSAAGIPGCRTIPRHDRLRCAMCCRSSPTLKLPVQRLRGGAPAVAVAVHWPPQRQLLPVQSFNAKLGETLAVASQWPHAVLQKPAPAAAGEGSSL